MNNPQKGADLSTANTELLLIIEEKSLQWPNQYITGRQVRELAGASKEVELFLAIKKPWEDELIEDDDHVNLARPGIEKFYFKHILILIINGREYKWYQQYITGSQLRELGQIPMDHEIFLNIKKPWEDELISDGVTVDLARPTIENFYSKESNTKLVDIKVNDHARKIMPGLRTVAEIKKVGNVDLSEELEQLIDQKLTPLTDDAAIEIVGGEIFFGHVRDGQSS